MEIEVIKSYKGFNKDMTCRGFQFEEGKEYEEDGANVCNKGFHACEMPLEVFNYYPPGSSVYHEVEQSGVISKSGDDSKVASSKIKIGAKVGIKGLVRAQIEFVKEKIKRSDFAATSGYRSSAATSGDWSSAATSGYSSSAATSGYRSSAATSGKYSIAVANGRNSRAKGVKGNYIVLTEYNDDYEMTKAEMVRIDGKKYKADTWYTLKDGKVVEWEEERG